VDKPTSTRFSSGMHNAVLAAAIGENNSREENRGHFAHHAERIYFWHRALGYLWIAPG
jgi:hypothetical protein